MIAPDSLTHRLQRIEVYADWLRDDADGLAYNLNAPSPLPLEGSKAILTAARARLASALALIDGALVRNHEETALDETLATIQQEIA